MKRIRKIVEQIDLYLAWRKRQRDGKKALREVY